MKWNVQNYSIFSEQKAAISSYADKKKNIHLRSSDEPQACMDTTR